MGLFLVQMEISFLAQVQSFIEWGLISWLAISLYGIDQPADVSCMVLVNAFLIFLCTWESCISMSWERGRGEEGLTWQWMEIPHTPLTARRRCAVLCCAQSPLLFPFPFPPYCLTSGDYLCHLEVDIHKIMPDKHTNQHGGMRKMLSNAWLLC